MVKGSSLYTGFPCFLYVVLLGFIFNFFFFLSSSQFKDFFFFCLPLCKMSFPYSVSFACSPCSKIWISVWLNACSLPVFHLPARSDCFVLVTCCFLTHVLSLAGFTRHGIFPFLVVFLKKGVWPRICLWGPSKIFYVSLLCLILRPIYTSTWFVYNNVLCYCIFLIIALISCVQMM